MVRRARLINTQSNCLSCIAMSHIICCVIDTHLGNLHFMVKFFPCKGCLCILVSDYHPVKGLSINFSYLNAPISCVLWAGFRDHNVYHSNCWTILIHNSSYCFCPCLRCAWDWYFNCDRYKSKLTNERISTLWIPCDQPYFTTTKIEVRIRWRYHNGWSLCEF